MYPATEFQDHATESTSCCLRWDLSARPLCFHVPRQSRSARAQHALEHFVLRHQTGKAIGMRYRGEGGGQLSAGRGRLRGRD